MVMLWFSLSLVSGHKLTHGAIIKWC